MSNSIVITSQGFLNNEEPKFNLKPIIETPKILPIPPKLLSKKKTISLQLLENIGKIDPQLYNFIVSNPSLSNLLDLSISKKKKAELLFNFLRDNPTSPDIANKLISIVNDIKWNPLLGTLNNFTGETKDKLDKFLDTVGEENYNNFLNNNLFSNDINDIIKTSIDDGVILKLKNKGYTKKELIDLLHIIYPNELISDIEQPINEIYQDEDKQNVPLENIGTSEQTGLTLQTPQQRGEMLQQIDEILKLPERDDAMQLDEINLFDKLKTNTSKILYNYLIGHKIDDSIYEKLNSKETGELISDLIDKNKDNSENINNDAALISSYLNERLKEKGQEIEKEKGQEIEKEKGQKIEKEKGPEIEKEQGPEIEEVLTKRSKSLPPPNVSTEKDKKKRSKSLVFKENPKTMERGRPIGRPRGRPRNISTEEDKKQRTNSVLVENSDNVKPKDDAGPAEPKPKDDAGPAEPKPKEKQKDKTESELDNFIKKLPSNSLAKRAFNKLEGEKGNLGITDKQAKQIINKISTISINKNKRRELFNQIIKNSDVSVKKLLNDIKLK